MKKVILSVVAVLAFGFANAQDKDSSAIQFGVKAGANYDWLNTGDFSVNDLRPEVGYHAGLVAEFKLGDIFSIQPEALYSFHSFNFNGNGNNNDKVKISQVTVPVLAKIYIYKGLSVELGPQASMILTGKSGNDDIKDDLREYNVAGVSGLAYDFNNGLFVQARYVYNLLDFQNGPEGNNLYGAQASVGYKF